MTRPAPIIAGILAALAIGCKPNATPPAPAPPKAAPIAVDETRAVAIVKEYLKQRTLSVPNVEFSVERSGDHFKVSVAFPDHPLIYVVSPTGEIIYVLDEHTKTHPEFGNSADENKPP